MKLLLDMYRSAPKEQRDKVQLMAAEKKYNSEVITPSHHTSSTQTLWAVHANRIKGLSLGKSFSL